MQSRQYRWQHNKGRLPLIKPVSTVQKTDPPLYRERKEVFECHAQMVTRRGIWNFENLDLSQFVADRAYEL